MRGDVNVEAAAARIVARVALSNSSHRVARLAALLLAARRQHRHTKANLRIGGDVDLRKALRSADAVVVGVIRRVVGRVDNNQIEIEADYLR